MEWSGDGEETSDGRRAAAEGDAAGDARHQLLQLAHNRTAVHLYYQLPVLPGLLVKQATGTTSTTGETSC